MKKWIDTKGFHNLRKEIKLLTSRVPGYKIPKVTYRAKTKIHGTNAGVMVKPSGQVIAQSRTSAITPGQDNCGFAAWVAKHEDYFQLFNCDDHEHDVIIYGEWCGPGIQRGCAIHQIPEKIFAIFAIRWTSEENQVEADPRLLETLTETDRPDNVYVIPWYAGGLEVTIDFSDEDSIREATETINKMVEAVEAEDPFVKDTFNISGLGEGLVFFPFPGSELLVTKDDVEKYAFKAKGEKHQVVKQKKPAQIDPETAESAEKFAELVLPEARLEQGLTEGAKGKAEMKMMGPFLKWVNTDVKKECGDELEASGLDWKQVGKPISARARRWFMQKTQE